MWSLIATPRRASLAPPTPPTRCRSYWSVRNLRAPSSGTADSYPTSPRPYLISSAYPNQLKWTEPAYWLNKISYMPYPHTFITLTSEERQRIKTELQRLVTLKKWHKRKPLQALYLSDQKKIFRDIANYLKVTHRTVQRWIAKYRKDGVNTFILQQD